MLRNVCITLNATWPAEDEYIDAAVAAYGITGAQFAAFAEDVKQTLLRGENHPQADFVDTVQQRALRLREADHTRRTKATNRL